MGSKGAHCCLVAPGAQCGNSARALALALTLTAAGCEKGSVTSAAGADVVACCCSSKTPLTTHPRPPSDWAAAGPGARAPPEYVRSAPGATSCSLRETLRQTFTCGKQLRRPLGSRSVSPPLFAAPGWPEWVLIRFDVARLGIKLSQ